MQLKESLNIECEYLFLSNKIQHNHRTLKIIEIDFFPNVKISYFGVLSEKSEILVDQC